MKYYKRCLYSLLGVLLSTACFDDKGNYDYVEINELSVSGFGNMDTIYHLLYQVDTLRIYPTISGTQDSLAADDNYEFRWEIGNSIGLEKKVIANTRRLDLPVNIRPGNYNLYFRVKDKNSDIVVSRYGSMTVSTSFTKGFLVLGDQPDGKVQLDMIAMIEARNDTIILRDILEGSGVPEMKGGVHVCHTGEATGPDGVKLWVMSESGAYYLNSGDMTGNPSNNFRSMFYTSLDVAPDAEPILKFPQIAWGGGSGYISGMIRGYQLSDGSIVWAYYYGEEEFYGNPINRVAEDPEHLLDVFPYVFYSLQKCTVILAYDRENERFIMAGNPILESMMSTLDDEPGDFFPWNQKESGRTLIHGDNTRSTLTGAMMGRSYALMKDQEGEYFIYAFYADIYMSYGISSGKKGFWKIKKDLAPGIDQATHLLFSSAKSVLYYVVGSKIYCYDYSKGHENCKMIKEFGTDEITWIGVDYWTEYDFSKILVATYNPSEGGTLRKFSESEDQNVLDWTEEKDSVWGGFPKIKSVSWRNSAY